VGLERAKPEAELVTAGAQGNSVGSRTSKTPGMGHVVQEIDDNEDEKDDLDQSDLLVENNLAEHSAQAEGILPLLEQHPQPR